MSEIEDRSYFGIKFDTDYVWQVLCSKKTFGVFPDIYTDKYNPLATGFPDRAIKINGLCLTPVSEVDEQTKNFLKMVAELMSGNYRERHPDWKFHSMEEAVFKLGQFSRPQKLPKGYRWGKQKECFPNAARLADKFRNLTYNEGFAHGAVIPVHHAWCTDEFNNVIDNTWR